MFCECRVVGKEIVVIGEGKLEEWNGNGWIIVLDWVMKVDNVWMMFG